MSKNNQAGTAKGSMTVNRSRLEAWGKYITLSRIGMVWAFIAPLISILSPRIFILYVAISATALAVPLWLAIYEPQSRFSASLLPDRRKIFFWAKWVAALVVLFVIANINSANHGDTLKSTLHFFTALYAIGIFTCGIRVVEFDKVCANFQALLWGVIAAGTIFTLMWLTYFFRHEFPVEISQRLVPLSSSFNRALVVFILLGGLGVWHAVLTGQKGLAWIAGGLMMTSALLSKSESAMLAAIVLFTIIPLVRLWGGVAIRALGGLALVWIWGLPLILNSILDKVASNIWINETGQHVPAIYSMLTRLEIWAATSNRIAERPFLGWGHDGVQHYGLSTIQGVFFTIKTPLHPHNGALQGWIDMGLLGPIAMSAAIILICRHLLKAKGRTQAYLTALAFSAIAVIFVSHGLWQTWWIGLLGYIFGSGIMIEEAGRRLSPGPWMDTKF